WFNPFFFTPLRYGRSRSRCFICFLTIQESTSYRSILLKSFLDPSSTMRGDELMSVDMLLIDTKSVLIINLAPVLKTILDGSRSKQSFRFADTPVSLLFEEVPESINFIHKELFRFQGYEELM
ncbi:unnamed protein product, partial [Brassica oleracea]